MNAELILLPCVIDTIDTAESLRHGGIPLLANRKEGRRRTRRRRLETTVFSQTKACTTASVIECTRYEDKELVIRSSIDDDRSILREDPWRDSNTSIEKKIEDQENEREEKKKDEKKLKKKIEKSRFIPYHICENSGISETKISICVDMHPRESSLVALVMHRSRCCVFFDNETGRTGQL